MRRKNVAFIGALVLVAALALMWLVTFGIQHSKARAYGPELTSLCVGYESATDLAGTEGDARFLVLQGKGNRIHTWHDDLPDEQREESAEQVDYVVCIRDYSTVVEECKYTLGGKIKRIRRGYEILVVDPETGQPAAYERVPGPNPDRCPESKEILTWFSIKGDKPRFSFELFWSIFSSFSHTQ